MNSIEITGTLTRSEGVRMTLGGDEVFEGVLHHRSEVLEAGVPRKLEFDFNAVAYGPVAERLNKLPLGRDLHLKGFVAPRSMRTQFLLVHITDFN